MKSVSHILKRDGLKTDKMAVLVGGPDWPTSVITGILRLPLVPMLLGTLPILLIIIPVVMAAAFQVQAGQHKEMASQYQSVAAVMLMMMTITQTGSMVLAGYYIQAVADENRQKIETENWEQDSQEAEVLQSIKDDEEYAKKLKQSQAGI